MKMDVTNPRNSCLIPSEIEKALRELLVVRQELITETANASSLLAQVHPSYRDSARNLLHYLALRRRDIRPLQLRLASLGLSSLGRAESHVLATVDALLEVLHRLSDTIWQPPNESAIVVDFSSGRRLLTEHTEQVLGPATSGRGVRIMVTMPTEASDDYRLVQELVNAGMDCMRINCAHDSPAIWLRMIEHLRQAERSTGRSCRVVMDLAGPKLRTGPLNPGPTVVRIRPIRDAFGRVTAPARVWLTGESISDSLSPPTIADACFHVPSAWLAKLRPGERLRCIDARNAKRTFVVSEVKEGGCWLETSKTSYIVPGTLLRRELGRESNQGEQSASVGGLQPTANAIHLQQGDILIITRNSDPGSPATFDPDGRVKVPAKIGTTIPDAFDDVRAGESIWFDDGKIGGVIESVEPQSVRVRITYSRLSGNNLMADKGINLPDSKLNLDALTNKDLEDLAFIAEHADVVELSFANSPQDVKLLQHQLRKLGSRQPAIVLKIETRRGFENLPEMLLTAMQGQACGIMIARGDLAVECGFERMAEVQEEILWICEAAHVPVIWATQVLETLAKKGQPSRAEITDAAMGDRAECVMLNKGPHTISAVRVLDNILRRMQMHQTKKRAMLRELKLAHTLPSEPKAPSATKSSDGDDQADNSAETPSEIS